MVPLNTHLRNGFGQYDRQVPLFHIRRKGRRFTPPEALSWGYVNEICEDKDALQSRAMELALEIAGKSPLAIAGMLRYRRIPARMRAGYFRNVQVKNPILSYNRFENCTFRRSKLTGLHPTVTVFVNCKFEDTTFESLAVATNRRNSGIRES